MVAGRGIRRSTWWVPTDQKDLSVSSQGSLYTPDPTGDDDVAVHLVGQSLWLCEDDLSDLAFQMLVWKGGPLSSASRDSHVTF